MNMIEIGPNLMVVLNTLSICALIAVLAWVFSKFFSKS
jgi:hypothetical protein